LPTGRSIRGRGEERDKKKKVNLWGVDETGRGDKLKKVLHTCGHSLRQHERKRGGRKPWISKGGGSGGTSYTLFTKTGEVKGERATLETHRVLREASLC